MPKGRLRVLAEREVMNLLEEAGFCGAELARLRRELFRRLRKVERRALLRAAEFSVLCALHPERGSLAALARQWAAQAAEVEAVASLLRARVHLFEAARLAKSAEAKPEVRRRLSMLVALAGRNIAWAWKVYRPTWSERLSPWGLLFLFGFPPHSSVLAGKPILGRYRALCFAPWPGMDN